MPTPRKKKPTEAENNVPKSTHRPVRILRVKKTDDLKTLYAKVKKAFSAADLQLYTQDDDMISAEEFTKQLDAIGRQPRRRKKK